MYISELFNIDLPQRKKRLLVFVESDGCFADGVTAATGATVGHRTMRVEDYGKIAAVFVDTQTETAIRVAPALDIRDLANLYAPEGETRRYFAQLYGYQVMPLEEMFFTEKVVLSSSLSEILSRPRVRVNCAHCGEEIINEREMICDGICLCRPCAEGGYYRSMVAANHLQSVKI